MFKFFARRGQASERFGTLSVVMRRIYCASLAGDWVESRSKVFPPLKKGCQFMRYISLALLIAIMYVSWSFAQRTSAIEESTHILIQEDIKDMIQETVEQQLPTVAGFRFERFWTESLSKDQVQAFFTFSFENAAETDDRARYGIEGNAVLTYNTETQMWDVQGPIFSANNIVFKDGIMIRPSDGNEMDETDDEMPADEEDGDSN